MKFKCGCLILAVACFLSQSASAYFEVLRNKNGLDQMNGLSLREYGGFYKEWKLVNARFRRDNSEIRLTYANDLAWKTLQSGKTDYPAGAVFVKAAYKTEADPLFASSEVPSNSRRYQIMKKDPKRYAATDGWGYALFDASGKVFSEPVQSQTQACHACHTIAVKWGYVFSQIMPFAVGARWASPPADSAKMLKWLKVPVAKLPQKVKGELADLFVQRVNQVGGKAGESFFSGTLDEIIPTLLVKTKESGDPSIYLGDADNFTLVMPAPKESETCYRIVLYFKSTRTKNETSCP